MKNNLFNIILHTGFWVLYIILFTLLTYNFMPFQEAFLRVFLSGLVLALAFYFNALILVNRLLEKKNWVPFLFSAIILGVITGYLRFIILNMFESSSMAFAFPSNPGRLRMVSIVTQFVIILISTFYQLVLNRVQRQKIKHELKLRQNEAELRFLKAQINPHFLFNTLNNIYSLAITDSGKTPQMILKLSDLLRYVIYGSREKKVPLQRELEHIEKFIDLFQMKSENPLNITMEINGRPDNFIIEPMILIPIVENCFKHTNFDSGEEAYVKITIHIQNTELIFSTVNTKDIYDQQKDATGGVGLENIKKRLDMIYPAKHNINISNQENLFKLELKILLQDG